MNRSPLSPPRTDPLLPYTTLFRSVGKHLRGDVQPHAELAIFDRDRAIGASALRHGHGDIAARKETRLLARADKERRLGEDFGKTGARQGAQNAGDSIGRV